MVPAAGLAASSWRIQGTAGAQPDSASPTCGAASMYTGEKSERRKRKLEAEEASVKPYACRFCSQSFDKSQALGGHMNRHRQEREREQLDNAQKLVLKQQSLQGLSGLPIQTLNQSAKLQGPTSLVSFDQVTLSRYNQLEAVQYQSNPRSFLPGPGPAYSSLHCGGSLVNLTAGTWNSNVGGYGTGSLASTNTLGNIETSADSDMARANGGATPEDLFAASVFQSAVATPPSTSLLSGRTNDADPAPDHDAAEQDMMYGYPGMTQTEASMSMTDNAAAASCPEFNFNNIRQSFQTFPQTPGGNVHLGLYCGAQAHDSQLSVTHAVVDVASPRDLLGQSNDPAENDPENDMKYAYPAAVSNLTPCACQPELEVSTCSNNSSCQQLNVGSARNSYDTVTVTQVPSSLAAANMPLFSLTTVQASHDQLTIPQNQAGETTGDVPGSISGRSAAQGSMCADGEVATHQSVLFTGTVEHDIYKACAAAAPHVQCHAVLQNRQEKDLGIVQVPEDCTGTSSPTLELVSFMGRSALEDRQFLAAQMSELETSGSWKEPGSQMGSGPSLQQTVSSSSSEQFFADSAPVSNSKDSPAGTTANTESDGLALHPWMLGDGKGARSCHSLVVESSEVLSKRVISTLTPTATGPAEQHFVTSSSFLQEARELDASGYIKVEDPTCALEYGSQLETGSNPCYDNITEQPWRSRSESTSV